MFKFLENLFGISHDDSEMLVPNLERLSPPSKRAIRRREKKAAEQIAAMKKRGVYLNVPFKAEDTPPPANVTKIRKTA